MLIIASVSDKNSWDNSSEHCFFFSLPARLLVLAMLFIAVYSPNLLHQHWKGKKTVKCPNNFEVGCSGV